MSMGGWHPVARSADLLAGGNVVAAFAQDQELALWRSASGAAQAWENRCPHRSVRLTLGQVVGDRLSCAYHGWQYAAGDGQCTGIPAHPAMPGPRSVCVKTYPVAEASGMVWASVGAEPPAAPPPADAVPAGWQFLRTLAVRKPLSMLLAALERQGWTREGLHWRGPLAEVPALAFVLDARPGLAFAHLWTPAVAGSAPAAQAHAAARSLRAAAEAD